MNRASSVLFAECGEKSVKVENIRKSAIATVKCGHCGLTRDVLVNSISEPVDAFGDFIDMYYADQELCSVSNYEYPSLGFS